MTEGHHCRAEGSACLGTQSCPTLCDPMNSSTPGLPVHHHLPEFTQTHVHRVSAHQFSQSYRLLGTPQPAMPVTSACTELVTVPTRGLPESSLPPVHRGAEMRGQEPSSSRKSLPAGRQGQGSGPSAALSPCSGKLVKAPSKRFVFLLPFLDSHPSAPNSASHIDRKSVV